MYVGDILIQLYGTQTHPLNYILLYHKRGDRREGGSGYILKMAESGLLFDDSNCECIGSW